MKGAVIALICAAALVHAELNENGCPINPFVGILKPHPNCNKYYQCTQGELVERKCASDLVFDEKTQTCDWSENVNCGDRIVGGGNDGGDSGSADGGNGDGDSNNGVNEDPSEAPIICAVDGSDGVLVAHENCSQFYKCNGGIPVTLDCWGSLLFNPTNNQCDWPENVDCGNRINEGGIGGGDGGNGDGGNGDSDNVGNIDPSKAPEVCAAEGSDGVLVAHEKCNRFYKCFAGKPVALNCWGSLLFNPANNQCDWPDNVDCGDRIIGGKNSREDEGNVDDGNEDGDDENSVNEGNSDPNQALEICGIDGSDGTLVAHEKCNRFYKCFAGKPVALNCWGILLFNPANNQCDWPDNVDCGDRTVGGKNSREDDGNGDDGNEDGDDENSINEGNSDPNQALEICGIDGSDGTLVAHEKCNRFYKCFAGKPVALNCWGTLLFNPANNQCDWPDNVDCGDRTVGGKNSREDEGNGDDGNADGDDENSVNEGNSDPNQALEICGIDGSDGTLVAHENCNQFYVCDAGAPVARVCWGNLLFNPTNNQCDWPNVVNCGDRVIDGGNGGNEEGGNESGDNGDSDNGNGGEEESGDGGNGGGHEDPSKAEEICAFENSEDVLVAHEDCNKFYQCKGGKPVVRVCYGSLSFNPRIDACDWPHNVDCGSRNKAVQSLYKHNRHAIKV